MTLTDYLKNDLLWNEVKAKTKDIELDKKLTKHEYLKFVGRDNFSDKAYQEYLQKYDEALKQLGAVKLV